MYIIQKSTRAVDNPTPRDAYSGPACEDARVEPGKVYDTFEDANIDCIKLGKVNPVGFVVTMLS